MKISFFFAQSSYIKFPCFLIALFSFLHCTAQIKLPQGFICVPGKNFRGESYFTNNACSIHPSAWGSAGLSSGLEVAHQIEDNYNRQIRFYKTQDNLYWATGKVDNIFVYLIIADELLSFTIESKSNSKAFSDLSKWLLQQVRTNLKNHKDLALTDYLGEGCYKLEGVKDEF